MGERETARMRKYGESKTTRIMMATVPHVTSGLGLRKFQADGFLLTRVYKFSKNRGTTKKSSAPEGWQETISKLRSYTSSPLTGSSRTVLGWILPLPLPSTFHHSSQGDMVPVICAPMECTNCVCAKCTLCSIKSRGTNRNNINLQRCMR